MAEMTFHEVDFWLKEIESSERKKDVKLKARNNYPDLLKYYEGEIAKEIIDLKTGLKTKTVHQNEYFPNVNELIGEFRFDNLEIIAEPTKPFSVKPDIIDPATRLPKVIDNEKQAPILKGALKYLWKKLGGGEENDLGLFDKLMAGISAIEVNIVNPNPNPLAPVEEPNILNRIRKNLSPNKVEEDIAKEEPSQEEIQAKETNLFIRRWNPLEFGFDYKVDRACDRKWNYKIIRKTYAEAIAEFPELDGKVTAQEKIEFSAHIEERMKKTVIFYQVEHRKKNNVYEVFLLAKGYKEKSLYRFDRPYTTNGFNLKIGMLDDYGVPYPISRAQLNKTTQDDINSYLTFKMQNAERNIPKRWYNKNKVTDTELEILNNKEVMGNVGVDGGGENIGIVPQSAVSKDDNELYGILDTTKRKLWGVSGERLQVGTSPEFAEELKIQERGFQARQIASQKGLRHHLRAQIETLKDIVVQLWDDPMWVKITGSPKPEWYQPQMNPDGSVANPLSEILSLDYEIDIDVTTALRPNKEFRKKETIEYLTWLIQTAYPTVLLPQGFSINPEEIKKSAKEYGFSPENLIIKLQPQDVPGLAATGEIAPPGGQVQ